MTRIPWPGPASDKSVPGRGPPIAVLGAGVVGSDSFPKPANSSFEIFRKLWKRTQFCLFHSVPVGRRGGSGRRRQLATTGVENACRKLELAFELRCPAKTEGGTWGQARDHLVWTPPSGPNGGGRLARGPPVSRGSGQQLLPHPAAATPRRAPAARTAGVTEKVNGTEGRGAS